MTEQEKRINDLENEVLQLRSCYHRLIDEKVTLVSIIENLLKRNLWERMIDHMPITDYVSYNSIKETLPVPKPSSIPPFIQEPKPKKKPLRRIRFVDPARHDESELNEIVEQLRKDGYTLMDKYCIHGLLAYVEIEPKGDD